jgi:hypothetical protein
MSRLYALQHVHHTVTCLQAHAISLVFTGPPTLQIFDGICNPVELTYLSGCKWW